MAVQPFSLPLDSLFSSFTSPSAPPAPPAAAEQASSRRLSGVGRTVIAIAATSVFFGGAGSLYMHAAMGHMSPGSMIGNSASMRQQPDMPAPGAVAAAPAMPVTTGSDAAPPRALGDGMPMPATAAAAAPMAAAPMPATPMPATPMPAAQMPAVPKASAPKVTAPVKQSSSTVRRYTIGEGDSFSAFAARYGVSEARIAALNPGVDSTALTVGQSLRVR